jgi:hypothetical protein
MPASVLLFAVTLLSPQQALDRALDAAEPPPALRAAFRATLSSGSAVRQIEYDPYAAPEQQFKIILSTGRDEELDAVVDGWRAEGQADGRLFADDLRMSLGDARVTRGAGETWAIDFKHKISQNDGAVDALISSHMVGRLSFDEATGYLAKVDYAIDRSVKLDDGTTLTDYKQTYSFGYSARWGVSFVTGYELEARGGRWGIAESRTVKVQLTDVAFGLAGDSQQQLASKEAPYAPGATAQLR